MGNNKWHTSHLTSSLIKLLSITLFPCWCWTLAYLQVSNHEKLQNTSKDYQRASQKTLGRCEQARKNNWLENSNKKKKSQKSKVWKCKNFLYYVEPDKCTQARAFGNIEIYVLEKTWSPRGASDSFLCHLTVGLNMEEGLRLLIAKKVSGYAVWTSMK